MARHASIISIDSKKRELVGNFKNQDRAWSRLEGPRHMLAGTTQLGAHQDVVT